MPRPRGSPNKRTIEKLREASEQVGEIRRRDQKKATEILNDLMQTTMGYVAQYHNRIAPMLQAGQPIDPTDYARLVELMAMGGVFAKALAPFQDPTFSAIKVTLPSPEPLPGDGARDMGKVHVIEDAAAATRVYQQMVRRIA